ncbi:DsbA family protein [Halocatena pleomorpha]|nr:thioredoxin domain-containing protein [Halocatena pleomorpha]
MSLVLASSVAGCMSLLGDNSDGSIPEQTPAINEATESTVASPNGAAPYMQPASGTTDYGVALDNSPVMGSNDAPIDMYYWSDYLCPFCSKFTLNIHPEITSTFVAEGSLRVVFLQLPNIGPNSLPAALLSKCVWNQVVDNDPNRFWTWHRTIFERQGEENSGWADIENLLTITDSAGFDTDPLRDCIQNRQDSIKEEIQAEIDTADQAHIKRTPAFVFVNYNTDTTRKITGTQPYNAFESTVQAMKND